MYYHDKEYFWEAIDMPQDKIDSLVKDFVLLVSKIMSESKGSKRMESLEKYISNKTTKETAFLIHALLDVYFKTTIEQYINEIIGITKH